MEGFQHRLGEAAGGAPVLVPGETCWRLARAARMAVVIDAADYFAEVKRAMLQATHSVLLIGWDFDLRVKLEREDPDPAVPNELGRFLAFVVRRRPSLHVHVLRWDMAFLKRPSAGTMPLALLDLVTPRRLQLRADRHHPAESCHHQKIAVIDDALAFCGGIDITSDRWDTPEHRDDDPRRVRPSGSPHGPWHDVTTVVDGAAAQALGELARERWFAATDVRLPAPVLGRVDWPERLSPVIQDVEVGIARTLPEFASRQEVREIERLYLAAIRAARRCIYLESQYFSSPLIAGELALRLAEPDGPEVVVINPKSAQGWLEEEAMGPRRALLLERLRKADRHGRLRFCTPVTAGGADIYVHAKVLAMDDRLLRVGSSNINNRSLGVDTECDLAVEAEPGNETLRRAILEVRDSLVAEHLGVGRDELERTLQETGGSLAGALDRLMRRRGKRLVPFEPPELTEAERRLAESGALDPRRPESIAGTAERAALALAPKELRSPGVGAAMLAVLAGLILLVGRARAPRRR